tara:strand:- start:197 stop:394 length:198 start_codon:yes stop_codon:yes gene_type:complete
MKNKLNKTNFTFTFFILITASLFITGCEDDAILSPQAESECTGSYCSLNMPNDFIKNKHENPSIF